MHKSNLFDQNSKEGGKRIILFSIPIAQRKNPFRVIFSVLFINSLFIFSLMPVLNKPKENSIQMSHFTDSISLSVDGQYFLSSTQTIKLVQEVYPGLNTTTS